MSTYGLVVVADVPDERSAQQLVAQITAVLRASWGGDDGPAEDLEYHVDSVASGVRVSVDVQGAVADRREAEFFAGLPSGRAVICEDGDEYGVVFQVWQLGPTDGACLYRAYVHDPDGDPEPATAARVIVGVDAATAAAELYGVHPGRLLELEADSTPVSDELGVIGTPFDPWMEHFGVEWPEL